VDSKAECDQFNLSHFAGKICNRRN